MGAGKQPLLQHVQLPLLHQLHGNLLLLCAARLAECVRGLVPPAQQKQQQQQQQQRSSYVTCCVAAGSPWEHPAEMLRYPNIVKQWRYGSCGAHCQHCVAPVAACSTQTFDHAHDSCSRRHQHPTRFLPNLSSPHTALHIVACMQSLACRGRCLCMFLCWSTDANPQCF
jgi:hypothetical protein